MHRLGKVMPPGAEKSGMRNFLSRLTVGLVVSTLLGSPGVLAKKWEKLSEEDGIAVYRREVRNSSLLAVKGEALIDASAAKIAAILLDQDHKAEWVDRLYIAKTLETVSPVEIVHYAAFNMPAIVSNRDIVYRSTYSVDLAQKVIRIVLRSVEHKDQPPTVGVRAILKRGSYLLYPREGGSKTWVVVENHLDPMGYLPALLVNAIQKSWPYKTLAGLRSQAAKPDIKDHPRVADDLKLIL